MKSSTSITFTTEVATNTTSKKIKIDGTSYQTDVNGAVKVELAKGTHKISNGDQISVYVIFIT